MTIVRQLLVFILLTSITTATAWAWQPSDGSPAEYEQSPSDKAVENVPTENNASDSDLTNPAAPEQTEPTPASSDVVAVPNELDASLPRDLCDCYAPPVAGSRRGCSACRSCCCPPPKPWGLPQPCLLQNHGIKMGGWLEQGITFNANNPASGFNGPVATNDLDSEYQMNQLWLYFTKPADNGGCGWAVGGHVDLIFGTDWRFGINHGLEDRINGFNDQTYGLVIPQAYVEVAYNDLSVKLGHFAAILDYEVVPAIFNPFYSHSYSYCYTVPQLVTGALADYKLNDQWSVQAGFTRGWSMFEDFNDDMDFMGGLKRMSRDKRTSLAYAVSSGPQDPAGLNNRFVHSFVAKHKFTEKLEYVFVQNLGHEDTAVPGVSAEWYGINQYFLYKINPRWQANLRVEWLRDDDGARIAGPGNIPGVRAWDGFGFAGHFYEVTAGLNWRPHPNVIFRPEVRWDWYDGLAGPTGLPFDDGASDDQFTFGADLILTF